MTARLAVATSLINEPDLLIWDEPTHGLDPEARRSMLELIKTLAPREDADLCEPQPQRHRRGVQPRRRPQPRPADLTAARCRTSRAGCARNHYELDLEGDQKAITKAMQAIKGMQRVQAGDRSGSAGSSCTCTTRREHRRVLANVLMTLADNKVTLVSIRSVGQQTEQAFPRPGGEEAPGCASVQERAA